MNIKKSEYELIIEENYVRVIFGGEQVARLNILSSVNMLEGDSVKDAAPDFSFFEEKNASCIWHGKCGEEFVLTPHDTYFEYYVKVKGSGKIASVDYFSGDKNKPNCGSEYEFDLGFTPIPTIKGARQCEFSSQESFDEFSYLTIPPLFTYIFDICGCENKLAIGLIAEEGRSNFTKFTYNTKSENFLRRFWLSINPDGHEKVNGEWISPRIIIYPAETREKALEFYGDFYFDNGLAKRKNGSAIPRFWHGPIACGWIEQAAYSLHNNLGISCFDLSKQSVYDNFFSEMDKRDLHPHIIILDDKWQTQYGNPRADVDKWSDLRGWIDRTRDERDCHTMLWYKLWDAEGVPEECTMYDEKENRRVCDPTNPAYRRLLEETLYRLISSDKGCYNADGLKLDFAFFQPVGIKSESYSGAYGVDLYLEYIKYIYETVKEIKPEAVISGSPCHPLFNKYTDHGRLHDYFPDLRRCFEEFSFRKMLYKIALPDCLIDTDGSSFHSKRDTMRHLLRAKEIGIPDLYCITPMPSLTLTDEDWALVSEAWRDYEKTVDGLYSAE